MRVVYLLLLCAFAAVQSACTTPTSQESPKRAQVEEPDVIRVAAGAQGDRATGSQIAEAIRLAHELLRQRSLLTGWTLVDTTDRHQVFLRIDDQLALPNIYVTGIAKKRGHKDVPWSCLMTVRGSRIEWDSIDIEGPNPQSYNRKGIPRVIN